MQDPVKSLGRAIIAAAVACSAVGASPAVSAAQEPPRTGFELRNGASWTTHAEELDFLATVEDRSGRVAVDTIGRTAQDRPLHLVRLGAPRPEKPSGARKEPTLLYVCTQHGNEPAGREACLSLLRDLAFDRSPATTALLDAATVLFVPTANPDGRARNTRGNSTGVDINRDHLNLTTPEARAVAGVVRRYRPEMVLDLHEYGPSLPVVYDDEVLLLWPRNLNVDEDVHDHATGLAGRLAEASEAAGYSADEYGQYEVADQDIHQAAGDGDEGIARNLMGLRHSLGILIETAVSADVRNGPQEAVDNAAVQRRRVDAHLAVAREALAAIDEDGATAAAVTANAALEAAEEGAARSHPVYFGGADNEEPAPEDVVFPPPCGYRLTPAQYAGVETTLRLLGVRVREDDATGAAMVPMGQAAEPLIPLLLDGRGSRHSVAGTALDDCRG